MAKTNARKAKEKSINEDRIIRLKEAYEILCSHTYLPRRQHHGYMQLAKRLNFSTGINVDLIDLKSIVDSKIEYLINYIYTRLKISEPDI